MGDFIACGESIIFQGEKQLSTETESQNLFMNQVAPCGIVLFEDAISSGTIETSVEFETFGTDDLAQIVFNYQNDFSYMYAGVGNTVAKYGFNYFNGQSNTIYATGFIGKLNITQFDIKLHLMGSFLELYVNGIKVLSSSIPFIVNQAQVGVLVKSRGKITISNFETGYKRPEVFIISQFGGDYDIL